MILFRNISGEQIRSARAIVRIDQAELARLTNLSLETIKRLERIRGTVHANLHTLRAIEETFQKLGVSFHSTEDIEGIWLKGAAETAQPANGGLRYLDNGRSQPLHRLVYFSKAVPMSDREMESALNNIDSTSRRRNAALEVTGVLLACDGHFLQALEGAKDSVLQIYGRICTDARHIEPYVAESCSIGSRRFADWRTGSRMFSSDDPLFADQPAIALGFVRGEMSTSAALDLLSVVAPDLGATYPRTARLG